MMEVKKTICDRCRKEIHNRYPKVRLRQKERRIIVTKIFSNDPYAYLDFNYDLCEGCINELESWLTSPAEATP